MADKDDKDYIKTIPGAAFGQNGFKEITGTEDGKFFALVPVGGSATLSATTEKGDDLASLTVSEGVPIYGKFLQVVVTAGTVLGYTSKSVD